MTAFLGFLNNFAIWIYLAGVIGILFGIKMLFDARRAGRTTLFTLEQEQASDKAFRAIGLMGLAALLIIAVASVNNFVAPAVPTPVPDIKPTAIPFTPPVILPTATTIPTLTPLPATPTPTLRPTRAAQTAVPVVPETPTGEAVTPEATATSASQVYPAPPLNAPVQNDSIGRDYILFKWGTNRDGGLDVPAQLPPDQFYRVSIEYTERTSNTPKLLLKCVHEPSVDTRIWGDVLDTRGNAIGSSYSWSVIIVQAASQQECDTGGGSPLSPRSTVNKFVLP